MFCLRTIASNIEVDVILICSVLKFLHVFFACFQKITPSVTELQRYLSIEIQAALKYDLSIFELGLFQANSVR